ncbi:MAG: RNA pseudouridine synthase [Eubacteriales bacterium]|nr:RNA pseudouridine synthase [Eubacteriales bacterium]
MTAVNGIIKEKGTIKLFHKKNKDNKAIVSENYSEGSKEIITEYTPICQKDNKTLLEIKLITGKSHQIRASFEYIGHSIIGDKKYNKENNNIFNLKNQFLHCHKIKFNEKNNSLNYLANKTFVCKYISKDFKNVLDFFEYEIKE